MKEKIINLPFKKLAAVEDDNKASLPRKLSLYLILTLFLIIIFFFFRLPPQIPLLYSRPWGEQQLTSPKMLFLILGVVAAVSIINNVIYSWIRKKDELLSKIIIWFNVLFIFLINITVLRVVFLII